MELSIAKCLFLETVLRGSLSLFHSINDYSGLEYARYHPVGNLFAVCFPARSVLARAFLFISENPESVSFSVVDLLSGRPVDEKDQEEPEVGKGEHPVTKGREAEKGG